jgi:DNA repair protein RadC
MGDTTREAANNAAGHRRRLRRRLFEAGPKSFADHELIEYLLALTMPRVDTKKTARRLLDQFGGVGPLLEASAETLKREGLSDAVAGALKIAQATAERLLETRLEGRPVISGSSALADYLQASMAHSPVEEVRVLFLNAKNVVLANEAMWRGSIDEAAVHVREVIARAIEVGASALIIVHNHPSGDPTPSKADIALTRDLIDAARHLKIAVHDHVVVGTQGQSSLRAMGLI